jgi:hypothetical protein
MVSPETPKEEKEEIEKNLKTYCGRDTYAMYVIWKHLQEMVAKDASSINKAAHLGNSVAS